MTKGKLRILDDGMLSFWCPGCKCYHGVPVNKENGSSWSFNGDYDKPAFTPSILVRTGHYIQGHKGECWCDYNKEHPEEPVKYGCSVCHSFVTDGKIQYLNDCTHELAGQTLELEEDD